MRAAVPPRDRLPEGAAVSLRDAARAAATICSHSSTVLAIGFSHSTCLPALSARIVYSACMPLGLDGGRCGQ
jgi:hypothetical protein